MKKFIINFCINYIKKNTNYSEIKLKEIQYGLEAIYITMTKFIIITVISIILNLFIETLVFTIIYTLLRMSSFGIHATKSWICLLFSIICFIGLPYICLIINIPILGKIIIGTVGILLMIKNSPADTHKKPIVSKKRRLTYKIISCLTTTIYLVISVFYNNNFISNCLIIIIVFQNIMISPITYKIFKLPYNNYKKYLNKNT